MKNKKLNRVLIPAVLLIWLGVIFRWERVGEMQEMHVQQPDSFSMLRDTIEVVPQLTLAYRDPFLEQAFATRKNLKKGSHFPQMISTLPLQPEGDRVTVLYKGAVKTAAGRIALVKCDEKLLYLKSGEKVADWKCGEIAWEHLILTQKKHEISLTLGRDTIL